MSSHLLNKAAWTAAGTIVWVFLTALKVNMNRALHNAMQVHNVQRHLEELGQRILVLEQGPRDSKEHSLSDSEAVSGGGDNEHYATVGPHWAVRPVVQQKEKREQPGACGGFAGP